MITFVAAVLATYRLAHDLAREHGPAGLFTRWRGLLYRVFGAEAEGVDCPVCLSWWIGAACAGALCALGVLDPWRFPFWWLGIAGGALALIQVER